MQLHIPQPGQMVVVRTRLGRVRDVRTHSHPLVGGNLHLVDVEYLDDRRTPESDTVVWEREVGAQVASRIRLPRPDEVPPDRPERFHAFLDAVRWSAVNRLTDPNRDETLAQPLLSPWYGAVQVEDYQLYPVLKALEMPRISLLLADDVGLGKTVEAGLILSELIARRRARRVLVICPATIQIQWQDELRSKFNLDFDRMDRAKADGLQRDLGADANPWASTPRIITSMDYLRQPALLEQFLAATRAMYRGDHGLLPWDLLIVDEAHNFTPNRFHDDSQRCQMLREIAAHFEHRLFLTATPHNGFTVSFTGLLELLDPVRFQQKPELTSADHKQIKAVMVRRLKSELNARSARPRFAKRSVKAHNITLTQQELALFGALRTYREQGDELLGQIGRAERQMGRFLFSLLTKRLLSSTYAFARTWWRHVDGFTELGDLQTARAAAERAESSVEDDEEKAAREQDVVRQGAAWLRTYQQKLAPFTGKVSVALEGAGWPRDRALAEKIPQSDLPPDSRWDGLGALLQQLLYHNGLVRTDERLIVFTEYRDTLHYLLARLDRELGLCAPAVMTLSGGAPLDIREAVKEQFNEPTSHLRILVATDAASEGLNLQTSCRYVIHQEVPWNPMRMEQRNGRVDRHGQARDVTIFHFASNADADLDFLSYVVGKVDQVKDDLGSVGQVFDSALQAHFAGRGIGKGQLDKELANAQASSEEREDLTHRDNGENDRIQRRLTDLHVLERQMGFSPVALSRLFAEAVHLADGQVEPAGEDGVLRLVVPPPSWKPMLHEAFRGPGGQSASHLPKLAFDARIFEERLGERIFFRSRSDTVLLRLGHPVMRRALSTLRRSMWELGKVNRWTVVSSPNQQEEAVLVVWALLTATNGLREPIHEEMIALPSVVRGGRLLPMDERLWEELARDRTSPLPPEDVRFWHDHLQEYWVDYQKQLDRVLVARRGADEKRITDWLIHWLDRESRREGRAFSDRVKELEAGTDASEVERIQRKLVKAQRRAAQLLFDLDEQATRLADVVRLEHELEVASFEIQSSHVQALRHRLELDQDRVLNQVLPKRFSLAHFDIHPVAVELRVQSRGRQGG